MIPELNIKLHRAFGHIGYVDAPHKYYDLNTRKQLISVTTLIGKYEQKFNSSYWSKKKAKDYGTTPEKVLNYWDKLKVLGTTRGSILHDYLENRCYNKIFEIDYDMYLPYLNTSEFIQFHKKQSKLITMADSYIKDHSHIIPIRPELIVGNNKVAGQVDFFGYNIETNNYILVDYKGLSLDTLLPTPTGFIKMKEIKTGDFVFDDNGEITKVRHVSSVHYNPCYKITFNTNDSIIADEDHKWVITKKLDRKHKDFILTTKELYKHSNVNKRKNKLKIKVAGKIELPQKELPVDPYVLGLWLGDGNSHCGTITCKYPEIWEEIKKRGYDISKNLEKNIKKTPYRTVYKLRTGLRKLNLLKNKHLPESYLTASYNQRLDLLRGFMDADGHYNKARNRFDMSTTKYWQAEAIKSLVNSLGSSATIIKFKTSGFGKTNIQAFSVTFLLDDFPFLIRNKKFSNLGKQTYQSKHKYIKKVEKIDTVPTKCISVESNTNCYLAGTGFIKTHNTDKKINYTNKYQSFKSFLSHLEECEINKYSLQIKTYEKLLNSVVEHIEEKYIVWFNADNDNYKKINIKELNNEAELLLANC